jgi:hypothetical protein
MTLHLGAPVSCWMSDSLLIYGIVLIVFSLDRLARDPYIRQTLERVLSSEAKVEHVLGNYDESIQGESAKIWMLLLEINATE